jgi:arylsulfatase A-like enzyme
MTFLAPARRFGSIALLCAALLLSRVGDAAASPGPWCGERPNIVVFLLDDLGWTSLPYFSPPIAWPGNLAPADTNPPSDVPPFRSLQSPTYNRLDARLCATDVVPPSGRTMANAGMCSGEGYDILAIAADSEGVAGSSPTDYEQVCEMDASDDVEGTCKDLAHRDILPFRGGIQRLAEQGTRFTRMYAASSKCLPSRAALITGKHGAETGATDNGKSQRLPREDPTFVKLLRENDYYTGLIGKWHASGRPTDPFGGKGKEFPRNTCGDGFDEAIFYDSAYRSYWDRKPMDCGCCSEQQDPGWSCPCTDPGSPTDDAVWSLYSYNDEKLSPPLIAGVERIPKAFGRQDNCWDAADEPTYLAGREEFVASEGHEPSQVEVQKLGCNHSVRHYADLAIDFIDRRAPESETEPFFLMVPFTSVHDGHRAPVRTRLHYGTKGPEGQPLRNTGRGPAYWALLEETDAAIGKLLDRLDKPADPEGSGPALSASTLVIFTSDQGPDGQRLLFGNPMLDGAKGTVGEAGIRVPTLVRACGQDVPQSVDGLTSNVDFFRTIAHFAGVMPDPDVDGYDLYQEMNDEVQSPAPTARSYVFSQYGDDEITAIARGGLLDGMGGRPAFEGVCGYVETGAFGTVRGRALNEHSLVSCDPNSSVDGDDLCRGAAGMDKCVVVGPRCEVLPGNPPLPLADRPRCFSNADCGSSWGDCVDPGPIDCNDCLAASWKLKTGITFLSKHLHEISSDPEETLDLADSSVPGVSSGVPNVLGHMTGVLGEFLTPGADGQKGCDKPAGCAY